MAFQLEQHNEICAERLHSNCRAMHVRTMPFIWNIVSWQCFEGDEVPTAPTLEGCESHCGRRSSVRIIPRVCGLDSLRVDFSVLVVV